MTYWEKVARSKIIILTECKELIEKNWVYTFDTWLSSQAEDEFPDIYEKAYATEFELNGEDKLILLICAKNLAYAIRAYVQWDSKRHDIFTFIEDIIESQLDGFANHFFEDE
jgi:hypothetical protein